MRILETAQYTNLLIHESSPYLLQHAHNPVNWHPWGGEAFEKARKENKLMLVSIGYSACHWCHVMEQESFEDKEVAEIMNLNFICIKVDREERPDVDQVYMTAVQLMSGHGGWPLNCFTLPDGKPIYGGTYYRKEDWKHVLNSLAALYKNEPGKAVEYAERLTKGVQESELIPETNSPSNFSHEVLRQCVKNWSERFDNTEGGPHKAPKFPLPDNYQFLLRYWRREKDEKLLEHIRLTLKKMAWGGIYDQIGGGFARYSTDRYWKVPHFEKMLYDNAQLVSVYSEAYTALGEPLYKDTVYETLEFVKRELTSPEGVFYSALDADSEGEEGKFYVWKKEELERLLGKDFEFFGAYYNIAPGTEWEHGNYIPERKKTDEEIAAQFEINEKDLRQIIASCKTKLLSERSRRVRPGLDDKCLISWNALMIKGYADACLAFGEAEFYKAAEKAAGHLLKNARREDGGLFHSYKNGKASINGYLEDYAFFAQSLVSLYEASFDEKWLFHARELMEYSLLHFSSPDSPLLSFTSDIDPPLIIRKKEISDNVTPASNSAAAHSLFLLGHYFPDEQYISRASAMLNQVKAFIPAYGSGYSNWASLMLYFTGPFYEVVIVGKDVYNKREELGKHYLPWRIFAGREGRRESRIPLLENKAPAANHTQIYICVNHTCMAPVETTKEALELMGKEKEVRS